ncbi:hypothetical protein F4825DRAFT_473215 [Nemania diffusa]|nr:hypothetical protein F4825DRAFT_473215 [Nemania diffusa]
MLGFLGGLLGRLANPQSGISVVLAISRGKAGLVEGYQAWKPVDHNITFPSLIILLMRWIVFGPLLYGIISPFFFVFSVCSFVISFVAWLWNLVQLWLLRGYLAVYYSLCTIFVPVFVLESIRAALILLGVPEPSLSIKALEAALAAFPWGCVAFYGVLTLQLRDVLREEAGNTHPEFWWIAALLDIIFSYISTLTWSLGWRLVAMGVIFWVVVSSWARITKRAMPWRYAWIILIAVGLNLIYATVKDLPWLFKWTTMGIAAFVVLVFLEYTSESHLGRSPIQGDSGNPSLFFLPSDPRANLWLVVTVILISDVGMRIQYLPLNLQIGVVAVTVLMALLILYQLELFSEANVRRQLAIKRQEKEARNGPVAPLPNQQNTPAGPQYVRSYGLNYDEYSSDDDAEDDDYDFISLSPLALSSRVSTPSPPFPPFPMPPPLSPLTLAASSIPQFQPKTMPRRYVPPIAMGSYFEAELDGRIKKYTLDPRQIIYISNRLFATHSPMEIMRWVGNEALASSYIQAAILYEQRNNSDYYTDSYTGARMFH